MKTKAIKWLSAQIRDDTTVEQLNLIKFIKKCVNNFESEKNDNTNEEYIMELFGKFYKVYCRKGSRQQAYKTFRKKLIKLKTKEEILDKARKIVKVYCQQKIELESRDVSYRPLCSSWLNSNVPD